MTQAFYVSPEQLIKDRADFAKKGIARGRSVIVQSFADGIALVADNPSPSLRKLSEIHDRIAFSAVGKYNEFEELRQAGIRWADVRAYAYDRTDVTGRGLASIYSQLMASGFTSKAKPYEVELVVAEVGATPEQDHLFKLGYDGSIVDQENSVVMGGNADEVSAKLDLPRADATLSEVIQQAYSALGSPALLEVGLLQRPSSLRPAPVGQHRCWTRLEPDQVQELLGESA